MILVDTSVWVNHFRERDDQLVRLLEENLVAVHDFVIGELACGNLAKRNEILSLLAGLPHCQAPTHKEILYFIERHALMGRGVGYIDNALLAAATLNAMRLWTRDKRLRGLAAELESACSGEA